MGKIILLAIAVWLVFLILKRYRASMHKPEHGRPAEDMVQCADCGVHVPRQDCITQNGRHYCSVAHLERHHDG